ncbi:SusC/RagA family TonB-linked outer membrane protein [Petrimonas sp.]|uniref:SusC/RagA family TonB-linked outer membrane protein n=1 Tax=Petrimonas TaxID=307628 RepID=UPI003320D29A
MNQLKRIFYCCVTILLLQSVTVFSIYGASELRYDVQQNTKAITGQVVTTSGEPLPGVSVVIAGTTQGTVTDVDGNFSLRVPNETQTLQFSFIGMKTQTVNISGRNSVSVVLEEETIGLQEVVAVGYGSMQRNRVSASIVSIAPEKVQAQVTSGVDRALEGQIAGLSVRQTTGAPGGGAEMTIRGAGSIGAGNQPLIVIDGFPMQGGYGKEVSPLALLNSADIKSIDVLKGVSATSIYGSRGSNGVILINTMSGEQGKTELNFNSQFGFDQMLESEKLDLMNAQEFAQWRKEDIYDKAAFYGRTVTDADVPEVYRNPAALGEGTDWYDVMTQTAPQQEYNLSVTHGYKNFRGFFSMGYLNQQGIIRKTGYERISMRANMSYEPIEYLTLGMNVSPTIQTWDHQVGGDRGSVFGSAFMSSPLDGPYKEDGLWERDNPKYYDGEWDLDIWSPGTFSNQNALQALHAIKDKTKRLNLRFSPFVVIKPVKELTLKSQYNLELDYNGRDYFKPSTVSGLYNPPPQAADGYYDIRRSFNWQFENTANYDKMFGDHRIDALLGFTMERYNGFSSYINGDQFPSDDIETINASVVQWGNTSESNWSMISYMARLNYDYQAKYLFTGTIRRDGSSRFGSDRRWGYFPSVSAGWNISKEAFFPQTDWLTNLKLRASYGASGNNSIGNYTWIPTVVNSNYTFGGKVANGKRVNAIENTMLGWERSNEFDTGFDLTLLGGRINFIFDYYDKITEDMLWGVAIPISSGFSSVQDNIGKIQNRGLEFSLNTINITNAEFTWSSDFNISFNKNEVLDMGAVGRILAGPRSYSLTMEGQPMAMFYGYKSLGIINTYEELEKYPHFSSQLPGTPHYEDTDKNGILDQRDKQIIGNPWPKFRGGFSNNFTYKNWDLGIAMSFAHDFDIWAQLEEDVINLDGVFNVLSEVKDRWRSPEQPGNGRIAASFHETAYDRWENSDWVHNASFLKVQNITLGYNLKNISFMKLLRLYCTAQNPFLFTNYRYGNPEASVYGNNSLQRNFDNYDYPLTRTIVFGVNVTF